MRRSFHVTRLGATSNVCFVNFSGKPAARYRWDHARRCWIRKGAPPWLIAEQPEFPAVIRPELDAASSHRYA